MKEEKIYEEGQEQRYMKVWERVFIKKCYLRDKNQENPGQVQKDGLAFQ